MINMIKSFAHAHEECTYYKFDTFITKLGDTYMQMQSTFISRSIYITKKRHWLFKLQLVSGVSIGLKRACLLLSLSIIRPLIYRYSWSNISFMRFLQVSWMTNCTRVEPDIFSGNKQVSDMEDQLWINS